MNIYEEKLKQAIERSKRTIADRINSIEEYEQQIKENEESMNILNRTAGTVDDQVAKVLYTEVDNKIRENVNLRKQMEAQTGWLEKDEENFKYLQRNLCPHEQYEVCGHNYHKNEEEYRCLLCGYEW